MGRSHAIGAHGHHGNCRDNLILRQQRRVDPPAGIIPISLMKLAFVWQHPPPEERQGTHQVRLLKLRFLRVPTIDPLLSRPIRPAMLPTHICPAAPRPIRLTGTGPARLWRTESPNPAQGHRFARPPRQKSAAGTHR
jgi:hypothetical protein